MKSPNVIPRLDMTHGALRATVFLFVFALVLAGANLAFTARQVNGTRAVAVTAARNAASVMQLCQSGNEFRAQQVTLWEHIVTISRPPPHETRAAQVRRLAVTRAFIIYIHKVFAPRNCHAITR